MSAGAKTITEILTAAQAGDQEAVNDLFTLVYQELRQMAQHYLQQERPNHTLQATALVHEVYLRLFNGQKVELRNRAHFFGIAATQMRRILVDHARRKQARRRNASQSEGPSEDLVEAPAVPAEELIALDEALAEFGRHYPRAGRIVELRYFGGLTEAAAAEVLGISISTLKREWGFAKVWLLRHLSSTRSAEH
jgi:RNA polymerase sigma factor (TIGR02999 family)